METPIQLRPYQKKAVQDLWAWFERNPTGDPCLILPTGAGKSIIIAEICRQSLEYPNINILMVSHTKEIIRQNAQKLRAVWPNAPLGIYSAGLKSKDIDQVTFAGLQSIIKHVHQLGKIDLMLVDEADRIPHKDEGTYRKLIDELRLINPKMRVVGLTATPWRLGHGLITDAPAIFKELIEPITIQELQYKGYLSKLISKTTGKKLDADGVQKRGGEYIESELQKHINTVDNNTAVCKEIIEKAGDRKHWCIFCTGVEHAERMAEILNEYGVSATAVYGELSNKERDRRIQCFIDGEYKAITNINILSIGFDFPDIDLIGLCRPTMSPSLYCQQAGRGLRLKSHTDHCLCLDFAGVVEQHGPITNINTPSKPGEGIAPSKICPECDEIVHASLMTCPSCGYEFPPVAPTPLVLHDDDIQGTGVKKQDVTSWHWEVHTSQKSGIKMLKVTYYGNLNDHAITEYLTVLHDGYAGYKAMERLKSISGKVGVDYMVQPSLDALCDELERSMAPTEIAFTKNGKFFEIVDRIWGVRKEIEYDDDDDIIFF